MEQHVAVGLLIASFAAMLIAAFVQHRIYIEMTRQVNRKKVPSQRLEPFALSWSRTSAWRIVREYRAFYPNGRLARFFKIAAGVMIASWLGFMLLLFRVLPH